MGKLRNSDFKSLAEIFALGGKGSDLTSDSKIWLLGNDLNKTLAEAITNGDIGAEVSAGIGIKNRAVCYGDGLTEEYGVKIPPYIDDEDQTSVLLDFDFLLTDYIRVFIDGVEYSEFIDTLKTPEKFFVKKATNLIQIEGDHTDSVQIVILVYSGVGISTTAKAIMSSTKLVNEATGKFDGSGFNYNVDSVSVVSDKTRIKFLFDVSEAHLLNFSVNGEFFVPYKETITTTKYFKKISSREIELDTEYSGSNWFHFSAYEGTFLQSDDGSIVLNTSAVLDKFIVKDGTDYYELKVENDGSLSYETTSEAIFEELKFKNDSNVLVTIAIEGGFISAVESVASSILVDQVILLAQNGSRWVLKADAFNMLYTEKQEYTPSFKLKTEAYDIVENRKDYLKIKHLSSEPSITTEKQLTNILIQKNNGKPYLKIFNTMSQKWEQVLSPSEFDFIPVGEVMETFLTPSEVLSIFGEQWKILDGSLELNEEDYPELAEIVLPDWIKDGKIILGNKEDLEWSYTSHYSPGGPPSGNELSHPTGWFNHEMVIGYSGFRRIYYSGAVNSDDTSYNDLWITSSGFYGNVGNSEQRAGGYWSGMAIYQRSVNIKKYIKVK